jgi:hypothetical protein
MRCLLLAILLLSSTVQALAADLRDGISEDEVAQALTAQGMAVRLGRDNFREPLIEGTAGTVRFFVYFYDCSPERRCSNIQFRAGFETHGTLTLARINDWSTRWRFGRLYLDPQGDAILDMDVDVARGLTPDQLRAQVTRWRQTLDDAKGFLGWRS